MVEEAYDRPEPVSDALLSLVGEIVAVVEQYNEGAALAAGGLYRVCELSARGGRVGFLRPHVGRVPPRLGHLAAAPAALLGGGIRAPGAAGAAAGGDVARWGGCERAAVPGVSNSPAGAGGCGVGS